MFESMIAAMPKVELHLHLEGSLRPATMLHLAEQNEVDLGVDDPDDLLDRYRYRNFDDFLRLFLAGLDVLRTGSDFAHAAEQLARELADQRVRYAEVTTTPFNHHRRGIDMVDYVEGLNEGRRRAEVVGVELAWICDIPRELEPPGLGFTAEFVTSDRAPDRVVALGLGGPEPGYPPGAFVESFARARTAGLGSVPHAGETAGPDFVAEAVDILGAHRIGHGTRSIEDAAVVEVLADRQIPLEVCLTSNQALGVVQVAEHPIRELMNQGVPVVLNTDDPAYFSTTLTEELLLAGEVHDVSIAEHVAMQRTAIENSFTSRRPELLGELEAFVAQNA